MRIKINAPTTPLPLGFHQLQYGSAYSPIAGICAGEVYLCCDNVNQKRLFNIASGRLHSESPEQYQYREMVAGEIEFTPK